MQGFFFRNGRECSYFYGKSFQNLIRNNMKRTYLFVVILGFWGFSVVAQSPEKMLYPVASDCDKAIPILIKGNLVYGPTAAPLGAGDIQELPQKRNLLFEKEHFTAWYLLDIQRDGEFVFEIVPTRATDDYDFIVFRYDEAFCNKIMNADNLPLRSNLSRVDKSIQGISGLMANVKHINVGPGVGNAYCKSITVKQGEKLILVLDNVYSNGGGHTIYFSFLKKVEIKGNVLDSNNLPVEADIYLSDNFGNLIEKTRSDKNGAYQMKTNMKEGETYNLSSSSANTFISTQALNTNDLINTTTFDDIQTILPVLKVGEKYKLGNITFYGDMAELLPASYASVEALYELMQRNKKLVIQIEGHVNKGTVITEKEMQFNQTLSEQRALTIYNYLVKKGIASNRLSAVGLSASQMIYPKPKDLKEQEANRRVEIKITSKE